jgi:iron(III) transport system ATP-binding protein
MAHLELEGIVQRYGSHTVVDGVSFSVEAGSIACLLGPSACGKTTLLRCIAGFEDIAAGEIRVQGRTVSTLAAVCRRNSGRSVWCFRTTPFSRT